MPNRTTRDYEGPTLAPHLQQALDNALKDEEDLELEEPLVLLFHNLKLNIKPKTNFFFLFKVS
jgi:hypothetical protein